MTSSDVDRIYTLLEDQGIEIWIDGGWAVDSLLNRQTRSHKDLDIAVQWKHVPALRQLLESRGFEQTREDSEWNFVLADDQGRELDVHAFVFDNEGNVVDGIRYPAASLTGTGTIDGHSVRCIEAKYMVEFLAPYINKWPEKYVYAVAALCEEFDIVLPTEY